MEVLDSQIKDREAKVYSNKAENYAAVMKNFSPVPSIDPQSKKIGEALTLQELDSLGIKTQRSKKSDISKLIKSLPLKNKKNKSQTISPLHKGLPEGFKVSFKKENVANAGKQSKKLILVPDDLQPVQEMISLKQLKRQKTIESMENLNEINKLKDELKEQFPDFALHYSSGSSFCTDEQNDFERLSEIGKEVPEKYPSPPFLTTENSKDQNEQREESKDVGSGPTEETTQTLFATAKQKIKAKKNKKTKEMVKEEKIGTEKRISLDLRSHLKKTDSGLSTLSKTKKTHKLNTEVAKVCSFFTEKKPGLPRSHIDLLKNKTTPIYHSGTLPFDSRVTSPSGLASVHSLRYSILHKEILESQPSLPSHSKCISYLTPSVPLKKLKKCYYQSNIQSTSQSLFNMPASVYSTLSPANIQIRYPKGFNFENLSKSGQLQIPYNFLNFLL